jgi:hypothetical protein
MTANFLLAELHKVTLPRSQRYESLFIDNDAILFNSALWTWKQKDKFHRDSPSDATILGLSNPAALRYGLNADDAEKYLENTPLKGVSDEN